MKVKITAVIRLIIRNISKEEDVHV